MNNLKKLSLIVVSLYSLHLFGGGWSGPDKPQQKEERSMPNNPPAFEDSPLIGGSVRMTDAEDKLNSSEDLDRTLDCCKDFECSCCCCTIL